MAPGPRAAPRAIPILCEMNDHRLAHRFDHERARWYRPRDDFAKTAVLVQPADPHAQFVIETPFGEQRFTGAFYVVAEGDASYGAARREFEDSHTAVGQNRWVKTSAVLAYRTEAPCLVQTLIGDHVETSANAQPGDWIVRQRTGEVMVVDADAFAARYIAEEPASGTTL